MNGIIKLNRVWSYYRWCDNGDESILLNIHAFDGQGHSHER